MSTRGSDSRFRTSNSVARRVLAHRRVVVNDFAIAIGETERAQVARLKGFDAVGGGLRDVAAIENRIVHHQQAAAAIGTRIGGDFDGVDQIQITVRADRRRRAHGTDHHHRLIGLEHEI